MPQTDQIWHYQLIMHSEMRKLMFSAIQFSLPGIIVPMGPGRNSVLTNSPPILFPLYQAEERPRSATCVTLQSKWPLMPYFLIKFQIYCLNPTGFSEWDSISNMLGPQRWIFLTYATNFMFDTVSLRKKFKYINLLLENEIENKTHTYLLLVFFCLNW